MIWALKKSEKNRLRASETLNFGFPIDVLLEYGLLVEDDVILSQAKGRTIRKVIGGGGVGKKPQKNSCKEKCQEKKNSCKGEGKEKKFV